MGFSFPRLETRSAPRSFCVSTWCRQALEWLSDFGEPKIICHPVVVPCPFLSEDERKSEPSGFGV